MKKRDQREYYKEYYKRNREKLLENAKKYYKENKEACDARYYRNRTPEKDIFYKAKQRARDFGHEFNLELSDIVIPDTCPILGIKIYKSKGNMAYHSPTLDRRDNSKGYVKGNVFVISNKANRCKSDLTPEEIKAMYYYVFGLEQE